MYASPFRLTRNLPHLANHCLLVDHFAPSTYGNARGEQRGDVGLLGTSRAYGQQRKHQRAAVQPANPD